jgi:FixJ family two-component response regulator
MTATVFVVDDDESVREAASNLFRSMGLTTFRLPPPKRSGLRPAR